LVVSCAFGSGCGPLNSVCGPCSASFQTAFAGGGDPAAGLATLKEQLKKALADTETQEAAMNESLLPQTVEEAEDLEKRLQGVLDELKARKAELKKRASEKKK
jgi:tripartite-type tricarboxylate transporter receptor subunit TctC